MQYCERCIMTPYKFSKWLYFSGGVDTRQAIGFHGQACNSKTPQLVLE